MEKIKTTTKEEINLKIEKIKNEIIKKCEELQILIDSINEWNVKKAAIEEKKKWIIRMDQTNYIQYELNKENSEKL